MILGISCIVSNNNKESWTLAHVKRVQILSEHLKIISISVVKLLQFLLFWFENYFSDNLYRSFIFFNSFCCFSDDSFFLFFFFFFSKVFTEIKLGNKSDRSLNHTFLLLFLCSPSPRGLWVSVCFKGKISRLAGTVKTPCVYMCVCVCEWEREEDEGRVWRKDFKWQIWTQTDIHWEKMFFPWVDACVDL